MKRCYTRSSQGEFMSHRVIKLVLCLFAFGVTALAQ